MFQLFFTISCIPALALWVLAMLPAYRKFSGGGDVGPYFLMLAFGWIPVMIFGALGSAVYLSASSEESFQAEVLDVENVCIYGCLSNADKIVISSEDGIRNQYLIHDSGVLEGDRVEVKVRRDRLEIASEVVGLSVLSNDSPADGIQSSDRMKQAGEPEINAVPLVINQ